MSAIDGIQGIAIGVALILATGLVAFGIAWATSWRSRNYEFVFMGSWTALNFILLVVVLVIGRGSL